jgi:hypothetical protein
MPSEEIPLRKMAALVEAALQGSLDRETLIKQRHTISQDFHGLGPQAKKLLAKAWEDLHHYMEDDDIPARDPQYGPEYRKRQREQLAKRIRQIRELLPEL